MLNVEIHQTYKTKRRRVKIDYSFNVNDGMTTALYGKSGIGKSTVLRFIAGLEGAERGSLIYQGQTWFSDQEKVNLPIAKRKIGFVFQDFNLFPNMTVKKNLMYASESGEIPVHVAQLLEAVGLESLMDSYPEELSGGQRQQIAILRALCQKPRLLLLDEPFSALDDEAIEVLIEEIKLIQQQLGTTVIVVSHRKDVIFRMADYVVHLQPEGQVSEGKPGDVLKLTI